MVHDRDLGPPADPASTSGFAGSRAGGAAAYINSITRLLQEAGHEVFDLGFTPVAATPDGVQTSPNSWRFPSSRMRRNKDAEAGILHRMQTLELDIAHVHCAYYTLHPAVLRKMTHLLPTVATVHDVTSLCLNGTKLRRGGKPCVRRVGPGCVTVGCYKPGQQMGIGADVVRIATARAMPHALQQCHRVLAPSDFVRATLVTNGVSEDRIDVLPLFSRLPAERVPEAHCEEPLLLFVGRLDRLKGAEEFIDALAMIREHPWRAEIVGEGPLESAVKERCASRGVFHRVKFSPPADESTLLDALARCVAVAFPSQIQESFGLVGLEAMSRNRPVVAFDTGGVTAWLRHGENGLLAALGDVSGFASHLRTILDDAPLRTRLAAGAYVTATQRLRPQSHLDRLNDMYTRVMDAAGAAVR